MTTTTTTTTATTTTVLADCAYSFSECTTACELGSSRAGTIDRRPSGLGKACPSSAPDCARGDGACPPTTTTTTTPTTTTVLADCAYSFSECTTACELGSSRVVTIDRRPSGLGKVCPSSAPDCARGDGACPPMTTT